VVFTMPTMARLMFTRSRNVTVMPRKNMRHSTYLAAIRSVGARVSFISTAFV
jgi:fructose-1,6-bisphosphatase/sedoheptulose 1,7-bisphosphatase-like protein